MKPKLFAALSVLLFSALLATRAQDRMPVIPTDKMTDAQKKAVADYKDIRKTPLTGPPWSVILRVPDLEVPSLQIRMHYINNPALGPKLTEFAILIAARHYTNNYEWNGHSRAAATDGLATPIIAAIADGRRPDQMSDDEATLFDFCQELLQNQSVTDATYARALAKFGEAGVVDAAAIEGYYAYLSMIMSTARSPLPANAKPALTPFPK
jgi:4-carboxymuconolactone decarboxylase